MLDRALMAPGSWPMSDWSHSTGLARQLDQICDRFEAAWKAGDCPQIEDYFADAPEPARTALLKELLALELNYRRQGSQTVHAQEFHQRFPGHVEVVRAFFPEEMTGAAQPSAEAASSN